MLVLPIGGWLRLELTQAGVFDEQVGTALRVIFEILVLGALGAWTIEGAVLALGLSVLLGWASGLSALSAFLPGAQPQSRRFVICPPERVAHVVKRD
jgi:hypothetical protein